MTTSARARPRLALAAGDGGLPPDLLAALRLLQLSRRELVALIAQESEQVATFAPPPGTSGGVAL